MTSARPPAAGDQRYEREYDMTDPSEGQRSTGLPTAAARTDAEDAGGFPLGRASGPDSTSAEDVASAPEPAPEGPVGPSKALLGPFTLREVVFGGGVALVFIGTLLPFTDGLVRYANFWNTSALFFVGIGILLPVLALALLAGRRLGSAGLRVGSLSVDQFASVTAILAATFFFLETVTVFHAGPLVALIGSLGMVAATVVGPFLPLVKDDFAQRPEVPAHPAARPITAARPRPPKPAEPVEPAEATASPAAPVPRSGQPHQVGINPAAAAVRQNGAGLYGAGGAGVVGAGPAASGQSGMERGSFRPTPDREAAQEVPSGPQSGAHAVGQEADQDSGQHVGQGVGQDSPGDADQRGDVAAAGASLSGSDTGGQDTPATPSASATEQTQVHDVVDDGSTRTYAAVTSPEDRSRQEPITATRSAEEEPVVEAFWFAVGSSRPVFDEQTGRKVFTLQPGDWEVGIEDRGGEFLVQDKRTGAVGILRDLRNIERAPRD